MMSLALVLNENDVLNKDNFLVLKTMESKKLDEYIIKNFEDESDIKKKYSNIINNYYDKSDHYIGKKNNGKLMLIETNQDNGITLKNIIYKKDMIVFREITKNKRFIFCLEATDHLKYCLSLSKNENYTRIFSEFFGTQISSISAIIEEDFEKVITQWRFAITKSNKYYDIVRKVIEEYKILSEKNGYLSLDYIYNRCLNLPKTKEDLLKQMSIINEASKGDTLCELLLAHMSDYEEMDACVSLEPQKVLMKEKTIY